MERSIGISVSNLSHLIKRYQPDWDAVKAIEGELTQTQSKILGFLAFQGTKDVFQKDVEEAFQIRSSTATGILKRLENKGLIRRCSVSYDKRLRKILITPEARLICEAVNREIMKGEAVLRKDLEPDELELFFTVIDKIKKNVEKRNNP